MHVSIRTGMDSSGRWWLLTARGSTSQENTTALSQVHWGKGTLGLHRPAYACSVKLPTTVHTDMRARNGKGNSKERKGSKTRSALVWFTYTLMTCLLLFIFWDKILLHKIFQLPKCWDCRAQQATPLNSTLNVQSMPEASMLKHTNSELILHKRGSIKESNSWATREPLFPFSRLVVSILGSAWKP